MPSPLLQSQIDRGATTLPYADPADSSVFTEVVDTFGQLELEYAAVRKSCALFDHPHRATIEVRGADTIEFLNRMLTQELADLEPWTHRPSFWLNRKGRIDADVRVTRLPDGVRFELDIHAVARTIETLSSFVFAEDMSFHDATLERHRLALHGPTAMLLLDAAGEAEAGPPLADLRPGQACSLQIAGESVLVERDDALGEIGLDLTCATEHATKVYGALLASGEHLEGDDDSLAARVRLRPAGWHAFNIARMEAGTPLFNLDFGTSNLPHETGVIDERVSFKKGCYLGQEVVARMQSLGHPKQSLVALRFDDDGNPSLPQPVTGATVSTRLETDKSVGQVTSSSISPMLGAVPVSFAMIRFAQTSPGTQLSVEAEGTRVNATVQRGLRFWSRP